MAVCADVFFDLMDAFIDYRKDIYGASDQTLKSNQIDLNLFRSFIINRQFPQIDGNCVVQFQYYLKNERQNCGGSINRKIFTLRSFSHFLRVMDVPCAENLPFYHVLKIRQGYRNRPDALTHQQVKTFFETIDRNTFLGIRDYGVYALMYDTGLRVGEVFSLNMDDVDFQNCKIAVTGKGNKRRVLFLNQQMRQVLSEWLSVRSFFKCSKNKPAFFISKKGNRLAIRTMEDNLKKILARTEIDPGFNVTCHTLRHSFASHLNDKNVDILVIQSLLGHSSPKSTQPYIHPSFEKIKEAMDRLPSVLFVKNLLESGILNLNFQPKYVKRE